MDGVLRFKVSALQFAIVTVTAVAAILFTHPLAAVAFDCSYIPDTPPKSFPFLLPDDLRIHPDFQYETIWYLGVVRTLDGTRSFGVEYMLGRNGLACLPTNLTTVPHIAWLAIADPITGIFRQQSVIADVNFNAPGQPFKLNANMFGVWQQSSSDAPICASATNSSNLDWTQQRLAGLGIDDRLHDWFGFDLCISLGDGGKTPTSQAMGQNGLCQIRGAPGSPDVAVRDLEQVNIHAEGTVSVDGETIPVVGQLYYQHMWGSPNPPNSSAPNKMSAWDWSYVRLNNGYTAQLVHFYSFPSSSYLNLVDPLGNNMFMPPSEWSWIGSDPWTSSNLTFFLQHQLEIPSQNLSLTVHTLQDDNLLRVLGTAPFFYEGASSVKGFHNGQVVFGDAFTEHMTGTSFLDITQMRS